MVTARGGHLERQLGLRHPVDLVEVQLPQPLLTAPREQAPRRRSGDRRSVGHLLAVQQRDDLRQRAAEGLTLAELVEVRQALMSAQVQHTWETISDLGSQVLVDRFTRVDSRTAWASRLMMMSKDYEILVLTVDARLEELDPSGSWQQPSAHAPKTPSELARTSRDVIRTLERAGLRVRASGPADEEGAVVLMRLGVGPLSVRIPCRVVAVVDEPDRRGFSYGTLPGHPECGEEEFVLERRADGGLRFRISAYSRPATRLARAGGPVTGAVQRWMTARYLAAPDLLR